MGEFRDIDEVVQPDSSKRPDQWHVLEGHLQVLREELSDSAAEAIVDAIMELDGLPMRVLTSRLFEFAMDSSAPDVSRYNVLIAYGDFELELPDDPDVGARLVECVLQVESDLLAVGAAQVLLGELDTSVESITEVVSILEEGRRSRVLQSMLGLGASRI